MIIIIISGCQPTKLTIDCSELGDEDEQAYCQRWVDKCEGKDDSMCDKFMGQLYLASAMEHKDHNYCAEINTEVGRDDCYFRLNTYRANAALCDKIKKVKFFIKIKLH